MSQSSAHVEHLFRHEYGPLVASLSRRVGVNNIDAVEDSVQYAMMQALDFWSRKTIPDNPFAWLYKVAYRQLISEFRIANRRNTILTEQSPLFDNDSTEQTDIPLPGEMDDSLLRMLFVACNDAIPIESQLVFTLKSLCGFSIKEIALRLFLTEANVYKRFSRAKQNLQNQATAFELLSNTDMETRLPMVHRVLYLVFTEGYLSSHTDVAIRKDLCEEAVRLTKILLESQFGNVPETKALLSLMYFHLARIEARQNKTGALLLLEQQDRSQWNQQQIMIGMQLLEQSARGENLSRYHVEASIAAEHCLATSFKETRWDKIVAAYEILEHIAPSVLHYLNRAIALAEWKGPEAGLAVLQTVDIPDWLERSYQWHAVQADLLFRCGEFELANKSATKAIRSAPSGDIKNLLIERFSQYET